MGESGGSAERQAEELTAAGDPTAGAWAAGADGERRVAEALASLGKSWVVLDDLLLWPGVTDSNVDHIVVGPGGIFLIDTKNRAGEITVYRDGRYQHTATASGDRVSRNMQSELGKVTWTSQEMTKRLGAVVVPVICLAGHRSAQQKGVQFVQDVTVVGDQLTGWLRAQAPRMPAANRGTWANRVMTEFPSTTADPALLGAIGASLRGQYLDRPGHRPGANSSRYAARTAPTRRPAAPLPPQRPAPAARKPPKRRRRGWVKPFMGLAVLAAMVLLGSSFASSLGSALSKAFTPRTSPVVDQASGLGEGATVAQPQVPHVPTCATTKVDDLGAFAGATLVKAALPNCQWTMPDADGSGKGAGAQLHLLGDNVVLDPLLKEAVALGHPYVTQAHGGNALGTTVTVPAGQTIALPAGQHTFLRNMRLRIDSQRLGLDVDPARDLALQVMVRADDAFVGELADKQ